MPTIHDQLAKQIATTLLDPDGRAATEQEVRPTEAQRIDVWFVPADPRARSCPGLLRRMTEQASMLEPFHKTPPVDAVRATIRKQLSWDHVLTVDESALPRPPLLWIISSGRPNSVIDGFGFSPCEGWPKGVYWLAPQWGVFLVAVIELPRDRDTLMLRLMGAGRVFADAVDDLMALPEQAPERAFLKRLGSGHEKLREKKMKKTPLTDEEEDFFSGTEKLYEQILERGRKEGHDKGLKEGRDEGLKQGRDEGLKRGRDEGLKTLRHTLIAVYSSRFGTCPREISEIVESTSDLELLSGWATLAATHSEEEFARELGLRST